MGVHGLWKLIEPSGQMVPLESLAGKVLAVDISIWLHQAVKGMHDAHGAPVAVAHLLILFHRLCKLLFYRIKPVFVFDGGVPLLKSQTMASRRQRSTAAKSEALKVREKLIKNLLKHEAVRQVLSDETASAALGLNSFTLPGPSVEEDLYKLPPIAADYVDSEYSGAETSSGEESERPSEDIHSVDVTSQEFLSLPAEVRHDILTELIETRKQSSWKALDSMPKQSDSFSDFQMNRLLKRHAVQTSLEKAGKEMGGRALSLKELESLLGEQGVLDPKMDLPSRRIAQDSTTRYMLVRKESEAGPGGEFDIMEHLEEVEWSSESDTDVILEQRSKKRKRVAEEEKSLLFEKQKNLIAEEVADILSVLEDKDSSTEVKEKVGNSRNKMELNINSEETGARGGVARNGGDVVNAEEGAVCVKKNFFAETSEDAETAISSGLANSDNGVVEEVKSVGKKKRDGKVEPLEESKFSVFIGVPEPSNSIEGEVKNNVTKSLEESETIVPSAVADSFNSIVEKVETSNKRENDSKVEESKTVVPYNNTPEKVETANGRIPDSKAEPSEEVITAVHSDFPDSRNSISEKLSDSTVEPSSIGAADASGSSSDSETDFIPITTEEMESVAPQRDTLPHTLSVVINPSESSQKDDLFADVWRQTADNAPARKSDPEEQISAEDFGKALEEERSRLMEEKGRQERHAMNLTDQIYTDAQELLRLFGIPFVVAPMEAEAQCATLDALGLTEGTITDDSDIWLFGGRLVYKNFFNQNKHVLEYRSENIEKSFKLTREEMIKMALLVGSDYTMGLTGIGPVTALEIIAAFQAPGRGALESLLRFRDWFTGASKGGPPRATLRKKIRNTVMTPGFPSRAVIEAYLHPVVDDSKEPFSWAKPNVELIHKYVRAKMGWSTEKCNDVLLPVLRRLEEKTNQTTIDKHFRFAQKSGVSEGMLSKRVENAVKRLGNSSAEPDEAAEDAKPRKKRKGNSAGPSRPRQSGGPSAEEEPPRSAGSNDAAAKLRVIKAKLHRNIKVPQREMAQKIQEEKKKEAIRIYRTYGKAKKKTKVFAKEEANLSESSSDDD